MLILLTLLLYVVGTDVDPSDPANGDLSSPTQKKSRISAPSPHFAMAAPVCSSMLAPVSSPLPDKTTFVLGPTPAMKTRTTTTPTTSISSTPTTPTTPATPNSMKRFFRKATKEDGMDKVKSI